MKKLLFILFGLLVTVGSVTAQVSRGEVAPDIVLPDINGNTLKLSSFGGKVVLIDFWASWCGPCRTSNREMQPVYKKYNPKGFEIFGVSLDVSKPMWLRAIRQDKINWPQVIDVNAAKGGDLMQTWRLSSIPATYLVDKTGKLIAHNPSKEELIAILDKLL